MSDEEYISDEEFLANLQNIDNEKLIQSLQSCGHDGYYNDLYYPIIEEIKRRLSSTSAEQERVAKVLKHKYWFGVSLNVVGESTIGYEWICENCKKTVVEGDDYCSHCGCRLDFE